MTHNRLPKLRPHLKIRLPSANTPPKTPSPPHYPGHSWPTNPLTKAPDTQQPPSPRAHAPPHKFQGPTTTHPLCTPQLSPQSGRHPQGQPRAWGVCFGRQTMPQPPKACSPTHQPGGRGPEPRAAAAAAGKELGAWAPGSQAWPAPWQHACSEAMGTGGLAGCAPPSPSNQH